MDLPRRSVMPSPSQIPSSLVDNPREANRSPQFAPRLRRRSRRVWLEGWALEGTAVKASVWAPKRIPAGSILAVIILRSDRWPDLYEFVGK